jgi:hypothetical protein
VLAAPVHLLQLLAQVSTVAVAVLVITKMQMDPARLGAAVAVLAAEPGPAAAVARTPVAAAEPGAAAAAQVVLALSLSVTRRQNHKGHSWLTLQN